MKINIFVEKTKIESDYERAIKEYYKRISPFCKLNFTYYTKISDILSEKTKNGYIILIDKTSNLISSNDLSDKIKSVMTYENSTINFVLLNSNISKYEFEKYDDCISISKMSISTPLMMIILSEQIYRAFTIINGKSYHK